MSNTSCPHLSPITGKVPGSDQATHANFKLPSSVTDTMVHVDSSQQLTEIGTGIEKLKVIQASSTPNANENERNLARTPPPIETKEYPQPLTPPNFKGEYENFDNQEHKPESPKETNVVKNKAKLPDLKRALSSPPCVDLSNSMSEKTTINNHGLLLSIPQSPAPNMLQHSTLTPITRNTYFVENDDNQCHFIVSPDEKLSGNHISNLAMPGSSDLKFRKGESETSSHVPFSLSQNRSLNSLPDEICLSSENYFDTVVDSTPSTPVHQHKNGPSFHLSRESPRSKSVDNLDANSILQTELTNENSKSPITLPDESQPNMISAYYNNISAPSEFFEHLAYNNLDPMKAPDFHSITTHNDSSSSILLSTKKPAFYRGQSMNIELGREKIMDLNQSEHSRFYKRNGISNLQNNTNAYESKQPTLQYQPSRRDDSLTDVGISKNTEGVDDIFTTRSPSHATNNNTRDEENIMKNPVVDDTIMLSSNFKKPISLEDRQFSIPSLHLANRLGNDSTASFTDGSYSWGEDEDEDFKCFNFDANDVGKVQMKNSQLYLPDHSTRQNIEEDVISQVAVASVSTDVNNVTHTGEMNSTIDEFNNISPQVFVEVSKEIIANKEMKVNSISMRKHENPLEWIHEIQCESENKIGESASSKFLTKGVSTNIALLNRNRLGKKSERVTIDSKKNADYPILTRGL